MTTAQLVRLALCLVLATILAVTVSVDALPIVDGGSSNVIKRDSVDPPILSPGEGTVWVIGTVQTVTWNTTALAGQNLSTTTGQVLLGFLNDTSGNEHLNISNPLASGFDIRTGSVNITVPSVTPGNDYIIALLGDSGNISPTFTITNGTNDSGPSTTSDTTPTTTSPGGGATPSVSQNSLAPTTIVTVPPPGESPTGASGIAGTSGTGSSSAVAQSSVSSTSSASPRFSASLGTFACALAATFAIL